MRSTVLTVFDLWLLSWSSNLLPKRVKFDFNIKLETDSGCVLFCHCDTNIIHHLSVRPYSVVVYQILLNCRFWFYQIHFSVFHELCLLACYQLKFWPTVCVCSSRLKDAITGLSHEASDFVKDIAVGYIDLEYVAGNARVTDSRVLLCSKNACDVHWP